MITKFKLFEKLLHDTTLYHGSPYLFKDFKNTDTFFSDTEKFAREYAETKSLDYGIDNDLCIYKCKINARIFDINNEEHYKKLENLIPDKIKVYLTNFPIDAELDKDEVLFALKGFYTDEPVDSIVNAKIGDLVPNPEYKLEQYLIVKKDENYVYTINNRFLEDKLSSASNFNFSTSKISNYFKEYRDFIKNTIKSKTKEHISDENLIGIFNYKHYQDEFNITKHEIEKAEKLYNEAKQKVINDEIENSSRKWVIKPIIKKLKDTWRYFENETIQNIIIKLNFDGYVALEKNENTYCIYNPKEKVKVLSIKYSDREFNNYEEIKEFNDLYTKLYNHYKSNKIFSQYDIYHYFKNKLSFDEIINKIDNN